jgi:hypothetical protein
MSTFHTAAPRRPSAKQVAAKHREIKLRYKRARPPVDQSKLSAGRRRNEIEDLIRDRHDGVLPDTDDRDEYLKLWCWHNTRSAHQHEDLKALGRRLGVELHDSEVAATVGYVNRKPRKFSADSLGKQLKLTEDERTLLRITTIGSHNVPRAERKRIRKALDAERKRKRRRAKGMKPRAVYLENSLSRTKPWEAEGICRRTWERRQKRRPEHFANAA